MEKWCSVLKKRKNSICCIVLSLILTFMGPVSIFAKDFETGYITGENVEILTQESFATLFGAKKDCGKKLVVDDLKYKYSFDIREDKSDLADVRMHLKLSVLGKIYSVIVEGTVDRNNLEDNRTLWFGSLVGSLRIQKNEYLSTVIWAKVDNEIQMSMTIQPLDTDVEMDVVILSFGEPVLTNDMLGEMQSETKNIVVNTQLSIFAMDSNQFSENYKTDDGIVYGSTFEKLVTYTSGFRNAKVGLFGDGQKMIGSFDKNTNRLAVSLKSYCSSVNAYYNQVYKGRGMCVTSIAEMSIRLDRGKETDYSYIANTESFDFDIKDYGVCSYIMPLIEDAITLLEVAFPTSFIAEIFENTRGTVNRTIFSDCAEVNVKFGVLDYANFDDCEPGFPIIFQLAKNNYSYTGTQEYILSTSICYRTMLDLVALDYPIIVDTWALDTEWAVNIELN